ncbi:TPA: hypothetical protein ACH3X1_012793 [Trebouxia sp. C0004]
MLGKFVNLTGAKTIPSLAEYRILPVKVKLPLPSERLQQLCYSDLNSTESERRAVVDSLLFSLHQLEASVTVDSALRRVVEGGGGDWMGQYMTKREFSGSYHVFGVVMPDLHSSWPTKHQSSHLSTTQLAEHDSGSTHPATKPATTLSRDEEVHHTPRGVHKHLNAAVRVFHKGQGLVRPLIPRFLAQLRPVAKLLGTDTHSNVKSSISSQSCANPASFAGAQNSSNLLAHADDHITVSSSTPEQVATQTATAGTTASGADGEADGEAISEAVSKADCDADNSLVTSLECKLPDHSSGNGVPTKTLLPDRGQLGHPQESAPPGSSHADPKRDVHHIGLLSQHPVPSELANLLDVVADK